MPADLGRLLESLRHVLWLHGNIFPERLRYVLDEHGNHHIAIVLRHDEVETHASRRPSFALPQPRKPG